MPARKTQNRLSKSDCDKAFLAVVEFGLTNGAIRLGISTTAMSKRITRINTTIQGALFYPYCNDLTNEGKDYLRRIKNEA